MSNTQLNYIKDSPLRSVLKGFTWRITATATTILIAYVITGTVETALKIGSIEFVLKFIIYYFHERLWARFPHGTFEEAWKSIKNRF